MGAGAKSRLMEPYNNTRIRMLRETITKIFLETAEEQEVTIKSEITDETVLLESGLDSLGFAILVTKLEDELGYDPFAISEEPYYPNTFGDFLRFYEKYMPKS
jgi:acyl carrier protein